MQFCTQYKTWHILLYAAISKTQNCAMYEVACALGETKKKFFFSSLYARHWLKCQNHSKWRSTNKVFFVCEVLVFPKFS